MSRTVASDLDWDVGYSRGSENSAIARDFGAQAGGFGVVVGELHCWAPIRFGHLADQASGMQSVFSVWIAAAKIVGQQRAPASTEADPPSRRPFRGVIDVGR